MQERGDATMPFANRSEADRRLANKLMKYKNQQAVVLALPS
jgi:predicted phosphoribosyltransferase